MGIFRRVAPVALVFAVVSVVTAVLWFIRSSTVGPQHLVFFYLLPIALVATLYGSLLATLYGFAATFCAAFFLYVPLYSFYVATPLDVGELVCFVGLALIGANAPPICCNRSWLYGSKIQLRRNNIRANCDGRARSVHCQRSSSELRGELIEAHDVGKTADFFFLFRAEAHDQRHRRRFQSLDGLGIDRRCLRVSRGAARGRLLYPLIGHVTQRGFDRRPHALLIRRQM